MTGEGNPDTGANAQASERQNIGARAADDMTAFSSLIVQFYRGEMERMTVWRTRLDQTTNWAVVTMTAVLTWAFSNPSRPHYLLLVGMAAVSAFLLIEARRFQKYDAWRLRVRMLQEDLFVNVYEPSGAEHDDWREQLSNDLCNPVLKMSFQQALTHRLRRIYGVLLLILLGTWIVRIALFESNAVWYQAASIAGVPGLIILAIVCGYYLLLVWLALRSVPWWQGGREFHPRENHTWIREE